ncbi:hypothetical protein B0H67DRAFT_362400 [Lasiosphaeris hirsuta]|uniref:Heterokaryon incompatibility domain-containing protein n=1 Tax=Lasiosphaeris hirsuta TaxID=260670 RepID=A0AA40DIX2_9PEZI|nr:hypothetical protein B0H67DRAFT_362400 [Lasiosphaeris hirsuta]
MRSFPPARHIPDNTGHESVAETAKEWLRDCKYRHTSCKRTNEERLEDWHASRLIEVGTSDRPQRLALRHGSDDTLEGPYAALSYCGGENPQFLRLTTTNIEELRQEIPWQSLPTSFQDGIITCRRLGIPYIWIDSLCILQAGDGSESDWQFHVPQEMANIYSNCELNIAIAISENPDQEAFRSRNPDYLQDCYTWTDSHELPLDPPPSSEPKPSFCM